MCWNQMMMILYFRYGADYNSYGFQPGPQQQGEQI